LHESSLASIANVIVFALRFADPDTSFPVVRSVEELISLVCVEPPFSSTPALSDRETLPCDSTRVAITILAPNEALSEAHHFAKMLSSDLQADSEYEVVSLDQEQDLRLLYRTAMLQQPPPHAFATSFAIIVVSPGSGSLDGTSF
jgi:hypothetical protein